MKRQLRSSQQELLSKPEAISRLTSGRKPGDLVSTERRAENVDSERPWVWVVQKFEYRPPSLPEDEYLHLPR